MHSMRFSHGYYPRSVVLSFRKELFAFMANERPLFHERLVRVLLELSRPSLAVLASVVELVW